MMKRLAAGAATTVIAMAVFGGVALAQETSSGINGTVHTASGAPLANAQVTVVYTPTNQTFHTTTDGGGLFSIRQLPPGGPYHVTATSAQGSISADVSSIGLGAPYQLDFGGASPDTSAVAEVTVTASRAASRQVQTGPRSSFNATDLETLPSFARDFKDIARLNPFVTIDQGNNNVLQIAGNNFRSNVIYIDGVRQSDDFGIGTSGYPTLRNPISLDVVQSLNVEVAPYDVSYGQFTGGVLNIGTKSGSNEYHGTAFYEYDSQALGTGRLLPRRNTTTGVATDTVVNIPFKDKTYGFSIGGAVIPDRVFLEFGYEKYEGLSTSVLLGPSDATGVPNTLAGVTTAQVTQIQQALQTRYGVAAGTFGVTSPITDEKYFGKLTWQITDRQRFVFEAQSTDGGSFTSGSALGSSLSLSSNSYTLDQPQVSYSGYLYSNWTSRLSTELSYTDRTVERAPEVGLAGTPEYDVYLNGTTTNPVVYAGTNFSYQANFLSTENKLVRARVNYSLGAHTILAGYEHEERDAADVFVQNANGTITFTSIADLTNGAATQIKYANTPSGNASAAIPVDYATHTAYLQDEWRVLSNLTLRLGVRDEYFEQSDKPAFNPYTLQRFGINNTKNLDGLNTVMPRFGFNYRPIHNLVLTGGIGRFSGGNPDVYAYNAFNGTGNIYGTVTCTLTNQATTCPGALANFNGAIPASVTAANAASANAGTASSTTIAHDFKSPSVYKASLSAIYTFDFSDYNWTGIVGRYAGDGWRLHGDYLYQYTDQAILLKDLDLLNSVSGTAPDGRPIFSQTRPLPGSDHLLLTNTDRGHTEVWALGVGKSWPNGIDFDYTYTHTAAYDVNSLTSSVSTSNFKTGSYTDPNSPPLARSLYNIPEVSKISVGYNHAFFGDYATRFRLFAQRRSGHDYSYTYQLAYDRNTGYDTTGFGLNNTGAVVSTTYNDELVYVPKTDSTGNVTATSDPRVSYAFAATGNSTAAGTNDIAGFNAFLKATGLIKYAGEVAPRNAFNSKDVTTVDLQFTQEIPAFFPNHAKAELYFSIFNLGNLINSSWGVDEQYDFPYLYQAVNATIIPCSTAGATCAAGQATQYRYTGYGQSSTRIPSIVTTSNGSPPASTWALKLGIRYKF